MRALSLAALALLAAPAVPGAQEKVLRLAVGETVEGLETMAPICDAPSVAVLWNGTLRAVGVGETLCSATSPFNPGFRRIYRVIVTRPEAPKPAAPKEEPGKEPPKPQGTGPGAGRAPRVAC